ncbi:MAG: invasion associated locus B family protein [Gammaproteobacteria bacterium]
MAAPAPQRTTATYGDWTVRCAMNGKTKLCEMTQATQIKGRQQPITQIAIGRQSKKGPVKLVFEAPVDVWLPAGVTLATGNKKADISASFSRCVPAGCIAETDIDQNQIKELSHLKKSGKLQFKDARKQLVAIPVSFKGFGDAYDALQK